MLGRNLLATLGALATLCLASPMSPRSCSDPEVRKEWRELSKDEKAEYLRAAVCVRNLPRKAYTNIEALTSRLDDLVYTHNSLNLDIHFVANFLPWHRWFVQYHEHLLRDECGFKGTQPYWDWTIDADRNDTKNSPVFDAETGFGGNGKLTGSNVPGFERCVLDGPFANTNLTVGIGYPDYNTPGNRLHCFGREFNNAQGKDDEGVTIIGDMQASAYNSRVMNTIYALQTYNAMSEMLEGLPHAQIHSSMGGDMVPATSPNEPLFFLHHANVDRVWAKWQGRNETRLADYSGIKFRNATVPAHIDDTMPVMRLTEKEPVVRDFMDVQADSLCYTYSSM
ncbi:monooxygenase [Stachybotrys elegans]|uniref:Monooxygenase n=1 Tax=Stachybotrys elegans TaxID=80388 RepID=A0A8K0SP35_9HYPO|nr:monooxygenase [Stachybotrys elegans]